MTIDEAKARVRAALEALWKAEARPAKTGWDRAVLQALRTRLRLAERDLAEARDQERKRQDRLAIEETARSQSHDRFAVKPARYVNGANVMPPRIELD